MKELKLTNDQVKRYRYYRTFFRNMLDHAISCDNKRCWCRGSIFNDLLADYEFISDDYEKALIKEVLDRRY